MPSSSSAATDPTAGRSDATVTAEDYLEAVLDLVEQIPPGRATTYGTIAGALRERWGIGGPRQVGTVLARAGAGVPWWRVVDASGRPPAHHRTRALALLRDEGCPLSADGRADDDARVLLRLALWWPADEILRSDT